MIRLTLAVGACLLCSAAPGPDPDPPPPAAPAAASELESRLAEIDERAAAIADLRADFYQSKHTALLREPLDSSGSLTVRGDRARWDTRRPRPSTMVISADEIRIYYPEARVVEVYQAEGDLRELTGSPLPRLAPMRRHFAVAAIDPSTLGARGDSANLLALELTPTTESLRDHIETVRVLLDTAVPAIERLELTDADGERTEIRFTNIRINAGVAPSELDLHIPEGTRESHPGRRTSGAGRGAGEGSGGAE